jgi:hypothetical protein
MMKCLLRPLGYRPFLFHPGIRSFILMEKKSRLRYGPILTTHPYYHAKEFGKYGLGNVQSVKQYEAYAGISFFLTVGRPRLGRLEVSKKNSLYSRSLNVDKARFSFR